MTRLIDQLENQSEAARPGTEERGPLNVDSGEARGELRECERCGGPARVSALEGYEDGKPVYRQLCLGCADAAFKSYLEGGAGHSRPLPSVGSLLIVSGMVLAALGFAADLLGIHGSEGFGWRQEGGILVGALVVVVGVLARVDILAIAGAILVGIAAMADVRGLMGAPGFGIRQQAVALTGLMLILGGQLLRRRRSVQPQQPKSN